MNIYIYIPSQKLRKFRRYITGYHFTTHY